MHGVLRRSLSVHRFDKRKLYTVVTWQIKSFLGWLQWWCWGYCKCWMDRRIIDYVEKVQRCIWASSCRLHIQNLLDLLLHFHVDGRSRRITRFIEVLHRDTVYVQSVDRRVFIDCLLVLSVVSVWKRKRTFFFKNYAKTNKNVFLFQNKSKKKYRIPLSNILTNHLVLKD